ncbi:MAG: succinate dehydrogenase [Alphaproteobacteria bacterium]
MTARIEIWLYMAQRLSAMVLAPLVLVHLITMVYAIRGGLTAAEILGRTEGSVFWMAFYGLFVVAAGVHGAIGLRSIVREMTPWRGRSVNLAATAFCIFVLVLGFRAVGAVT